MRRDELIEQMVSRDRLHYFINCAVSLDSKLSRRGERVDISTREDWEVVMHLRNNVAAIVVGSETVITDDPTLKTRKEYLETEEVSHPVRVVLDRRGRVQSSSMLFRTDVSDVLWVTSEPRPVPEHVQVVRCSRDSSVLEMSELVLQELQDLGERGGILVEGGAGIITSFLNSGLVPLMRIFRNPIVLSQGVDLFNSDVEVKLGLETVTKLGAGVEEIYSVVER